MKIMKPVVLALDTDVNVIDEALLVIVVVTPLEELFMTARNTKS